MVDEWFRSPAWGPVDRADFEARLGRARKSSRDQYLRIKGLALMEAGEPEGARSLWLRVLDNGGTLGSQQWATLEHLGDLDFDQAPAEAELRYRELLDTNPTLNGTTQMVEVKLADLLIRTATPAALDEAGRLLGSWAANRHAPFPAQRFDWELIRARWGEVTGREDVMREAARQAVLLLSAPAPFSRHPGVGVVDADSKTVAWLRRRS